MPVKKVQQSVPAGTLPVVEPPVQPPPAWLPPTPPRPGLPSSPLPAEDQVEYPSEDGLPMATSPSHSKWIIGCYRALQHRYRGRTDMYLGCNMLVYYEQGNREAAVAPDLFVSFGVPLGRMPPEEQMNYRVWREGKPPDVVWEFGPPLSIKGDAGEKKERYRRMGVREYWLGDPVGGYHEPRVQGFALVDGAYERMPWEECPDGMVTAWSPLLRLELRFADGRLRFWDREVGRYLELPEEEEERLRHIAEARFERDRRARQEADARIERANRARREAEARIERHRRARQEADARTERHRRARQEADARTERATQALEIEKRATKVLKVRLAELEAEARRTRSPK